jgi:hypothetical protein
MPANPGKFFIRSGPQRPNNARPIHAQHHCKEPRSSHSQLEAEKVTEFIASASGKSGWHFFRRTSTIGRSSSDHVH